MKRREYKVVRGDDRFIYSTGEIVEALQGAGVLTDAALAIARAFEGHLRSRGNTTISLDEVIDRLEKLIAERVNREIAVRFRKQTPPFVPLKVARGDRVEPFSIRKLTRSLESLGLKFKVANSIARQVEQTLRTQGSETVPYMVMAHNVALALEANLGRDWRVLFEATLSRPAEIAVEEPDGSLMPFSRGVVSRSLMAIGLGPEMGYRLANTLEDRLWRSGEHQVTRPYLRRLITQLLQEEAGEQYARMYDVLHNFKLSGTPTIVLVGGAPGVGKSTIAAELAYRLGIGRLVSTDSVREALRSLISRELSPVLHASTFSAWKAELLPEESAAGKPHQQRVIRGFMSQVRMLGPAINGIISRNLDEAASVVLEGVHLVPGASMRTDLAAQVVPIMLVVDDKESHRDHFGLRERQTASKRLQQTYVEHFREVRLIQDYLQDQSRHEGVKLIDATDADDAVEACLHHVLSTLFTARLDRAAAAGTE